MAINNYELANKPYARGFGDNVVTVVEIRLLDGNRYSINMRELVGDRTNDPEDALISSVLDILRVELDPASAIVKAQNKLEQTEQKLEDTQTKQRETDEMVRQIQENALLNRKTIYGLVLNSVMSKNVAYGSIYKELVSLIPLAIEGQEYATHDLFTIEDPNHIEVDGEGKRILVQVNHAFTYNGEPVSDFVEGGRLELNGTGVAWKFEGKE